MIIGLVGFKQVGKSTAAKYLEDKYSAVRINMKDALVAELRKNFPTLLEEIARTTDFDQGLERAIDELFETKPPLMRALMQNYGTEVRRGDNPDYWTDRWKESAGQLIDGTNIVVDDVRFLNEAAAVREMGGIIVRLVRPDITSGGTHTSETEQLSIEVDHTIECFPGDHQHLYDALDALMERTADRPLNYERA